MTENTFNIQDDPLSWIFVASNLASILFILFRVSVLSILDQSVLRSSKVAPGKRRIVASLSWKKRIVTGFPALFSLELLIRSLSRATNNACAIAVPFSYFLRLSIHNVMLVFQLRALVIIKGSSSFVFSPSKQQRFNAYIFPCLMTPVVLLTIFFWATEAGTQLDGVCTLGSAGTNATLLGYHYTVWLTQGLEFIYSFFNVLIEFSLDENSLIPSYRKRELRIATRICLFLLLWDSLFRFQLFQKIIAAAYGDDTSTEYHNTVKGIAIFFVVTYCFGLSCFMSYSYELTWVQHCNLTHPFQSRYWRLLRRQEYLTDNEVMWKTRSDNSNLKAARQRLVVADPKLSSNPNDLKSLIDPSSSGYDEETNSMDLMLISSRSSVSYLDHSDHDDGDEF